MLWMEKVKNALEKNVQNVKEFNIPGINIRTEIMKKKLDGTIYRFDTRLVVAKVCCSARCIEKSILQNYNKY